MQAGWNESKRENGFEPHEQTSWRWQRFAPYPRQLGLLINIVFHVIYDCEGGDGGDVHDVDDDDDDDDDGGVGGGDDDGDGDSGDDDDGGGGG